MNAPVTKLDQRYSDPDAEAVSWDDTQRLLAAAEVTWISTVRADGRPHVTPVVSAWTDGALYFTTGAEEQKYVNLQANPHVVLMTGSSDWDQGIGVVGATTHRF
jgi:nitroimidazol reductase NimA-like FMN-containing flavoprotein (pyridoxamine 5'-phosphate oxidase superfamily)